MPYTNPARSATLTVFRGLPASGKSTLAKKMVKGAKPGTMVRINKDDLRAMMHGFWAGDVTERQIVAARNAIVVENLGRGVDVVVDDTNLRWTHVNTLAALAWELGAAFVLHDLTRVDVEECIRRDAGRGDDKVGEQVIMKMAKQLSRAKGKAPEHAPIFPVVPVKGLPPIVITDIDGTLASMNGRDPYDESRVSEDLPRPDAIGRVQELLAAGRTVFAFSGRTSACREDTTLWLKEHLGAELPLFMRAEGDNRRDSFIKYDLFNEHIRDRFHVDYVLDDRDQVVRMWRTLGVVCHQVAPGPF